MNLLYCIPALYNAGGMERVLTEKVNELSATGKYEITIVTTDQQERDIWFLLDHSIRVIHLNINFDEHINDFLVKKFILHKRKLRLYKSRLTDIINELNIDICVSLCGKEVEFLGNLPVKSKKIAEIHFSMNNRKQFILARHSGLLWKIIGNVRTYQLKQSVKKLDKLIVLTSDDYKQWKRYFDKVVMIPNPNPLPNNVCSDLKSKRVIAIGKLDPQKGFDMLIDAWAIVSHKHPDWTLDIFGVGEWEDKLRNNIYELNLSNSIYLHGLTSDVVAQYSNSSIYVMTSRYEGMPMVLIEAMSCGLPVVSFDCEWGPRELIEDGLNGFLVKPFDVTGFSDKVCELILDNDLRNIMGINARKKMENYSKTIIMDKWITLFDEIKMNSLKSEL